MYLPTKYNKYALCFAFASWRIMLPMYSVYGLERDNKYAFVKSV